MLVHSCIIAWRILRISKRIKNVPLEISEANKILKGRRSFAFFSFPVRITVSQKPDRVLIMAGLRVRSHKRGDLYRNVQFSYFPWKHSRTTVWHKVNWKKKRETSVISGSSMWTSPLFHINPSSLHFSFCCLCIIYLWSVEKILLGS